MKYQLEAKLGALVQQMSEEAQAAAEERKYGIDQGAEAGSPAPEPASAGVPGNPPGDLNNIPFEPLLELYTSCHHQLALKASLGLCF